MSLNAFFLDIGHFLSVTQGWDPAEIGLYMRLITYQWKNGSIPSESKKMAEICSVSGKKMAKFWTKKVQNEFPPISSSFLQNPWLEEVRERQANYLRSQSEKGRLGAQKRWGQLRIAFSK